RVMLFLVHGKDVVLTEDDDLLAVDLDLVTRVLPEQHLVAGLHVERTHVAGIEDLAFADGNHFAPARLLGRGVGDDDAAGRGSGLFHPPDDHAIVQGTNVHLLHPPVEYKFLCFLEICLTWHSLEESASKYRDGFRPVKPPARGAIAQRRHPMPGSRCGAVTSPAPTVWKDLPRSRPRHLSRRCH